MLCGLILDCWSFRVLGKSLMLTCGSKGWLCGLKVNATGKPRVAQGGEGLRTRLVYHRHRVTQWLHTSFVPMTCQRRDSDLQAYGA